MEKPTLYTQTITLDDGREIIIETGRLAKQANGSVLLRMENTILLATVVASSEPRAGADFLPLTVDYQEKYSATGRFPGGFFKRENRLSDYEVLISRLVDRALRPLFPDDFHHDTQVMISLLSADDKNAPDALAGLAASAALTISDIPFQGPISEVRVAKINGKLEVNPHMGQAEHTTLDIMVSGSMSDINMVEGEMKEVSEQEMLEAIKLAHEAIKKQCQAQLELREKCGKPKFEFEPAVHDESLEAMVNDMFADKIYEVASAALPKEERSSRFKTMLKDYLESLPEDSEIDTELVKRYYKKLMKNRVRQMAIEERKRLDGRRLDEVRPIWCETDLLPRVHGSALFTRGETQVLSSVTLGTKLDEQLIDGAIFKGTTKFLLHYNFPGYSTGEVKPNRAPARREVGHGNLALRALKAILPGEDKNPYTVRIVADVLESNGSSSMATVCSGSMALMDAGIKMPKAISGIAMGLISEGGKYAVLSDILGDEDHLGDMDFKVAGTRDGITACQMDLKVEGLSYEVLEEAMEQARRGRLHILDEMEKAISQPREDYKAFVPRMERFTIPSEFIGMVIGGGGKTIQNIQKTTGTVVAIDEADGKGIVEISATNPEAIERAVKWIKGMIEEPEEGKVYHGKVVGLKEFGAFVEFLPGKEGLLHISEISYDRLPSMEGVLEEGQEVDVQLVSVEPNGKFRLSMKSLQTPPEGYTPPPPRDRSGGGDRDRGGRGGFGGGRGGDRGGRGGDRDRGGDRGGRGGFGGRDRGGFGDRDRGGDRNDRGGDRGGFSDRGRDNEGRGNSNDRGDGGGFRRDNED